MICNLVRCCICRQDDLDSSVDDDDVKDDGHDHNDDEIHDDIFKHIALQLIITGSYSFIYINMVGLQRKTKGLSRESDSNDDDDVIPTSKHIIKQ